MECGCGLDDGMWNTRRLEDVRDFQRIFALIALSHLDPVTGPDTPLEIHHEQNNRIINLALLIHLYNLLDMDSSFSLDIRICLLSALFGSLSFFGILQASHALK
jgi:hypothetical protein